MDPIVARKTWRTLEPVHGLIYFAPEAAEAYAGLGLTAGYFASRAAAMGPVPAEVVIATFFNFHPDFVRETIPSAWEIAAPIDIAKARCHAAGAAIRRVAGEFADGPEVAEAATLAKRAAEAACRWLEGRPLFAAHAALPWPDDPLLVLWHAQTLLREFRGDAHVAALTIEGVSGLESLVVHGATGEVAPETLRATRQWPEEDWSAAQYRLQARGWLTEDGTLTAAGRAHRQWVEDRTDALSVKPYEVIGEEACERLRALVRPLSKAIVEAGALGFRPS